jgi:hypothetical protein
MLLAGAAMAPLFVASLAAADLTGAWGLEFQRNDSSSLYQGECNFKQEGDRLSGSCLSGFESIVPVRGNVKGASVTFEFSTGVESATTATFSGQLDAQETLIKGTWRFVDPQGNKGEGTFTATKR